MGKPDYSNKYLSTSSLARLLEVSGPELFLMFENKGYLLKEEGQWRLTQLGLELGGKYGSVGGPAKFPIWPITIKNLNLFKEIKEKKLKNNIHTESRKSGNINKPLYQYINDSPRKILKKVFGYDDFKENQIDIIETILNGKNAFVLMPTGSGKSLCYQIPSIIRNGVGIVISPLIALMEDQVKGLQQNGVSAAYLNSTLPFKKAKIIQEKAADGQINILYVAPEKLLTPDFQHFLAKIKISLFAIDEVHCVSQWGHDFRPEYRRINEVTKKYPETPRIALTATADAITQKDILDKLGLKNAELFISSFDRPNIRYHVLAKRGEKGQLFNYLQKNRNKGSGIVYVRTRKRSENIARWLTQQGIVSLPYHAGLSSEIRFENQNRFQENDIRIIVATIAFGMGIDKPDVRFVIHLDLPASMEAYYQETGRAGRDGQQADAWMLYSLSDVVAMRRIFELSEGSNEYKHVKRKKLDALLGYCESVECRRKLLLNYFGENYDGPCQACDNCLNPAETWDGTVAAQKALSCVYRTGQRFGALHLANVLMGKHTKQVLRWNHDRIKTFGIGKELDEKTWMSVFRQLLSAAFLSVDLGQFSGIRLTKESWTILRGKQKVFFRNDLAYSKAKNNKKPSTSIEGIFNNENKLDLFETLRKLRLKISRQLKVPPYIIFNDQSLKEMALFKPATVNEFLKITGVGEFKAQRYSQIFLNCIRGEEVDLQGYFENIQNPVIEVTKNETIIIDTDTTKPSNINLLGKGKLRPTEIEEKSEASLPTVLDYNANLTISKYDDVLDEESRDKIPSLDWEPSHQVREFIKQKILALGSLETVYNFYNDDSPICKFAKRIAPQILSEISLEKPKPCIEKISEKFEKSNTKNMVNDPLQKSVICLAVSKKYRGYCVAGKEMLKEGNPTWIRPVSSKRMGELNFATIQLTNGNTPCILDVIKFTVKKPFPHFYQAENYLIDRSRPWEKIGQSQILEIADLCDTIEKLWENGHHSVNGKNDKIPIEIANEKCEFSLVLIKPIELKLLLSSGLTYKKKIRAEFFYNGITYNFSVTDTIVEKEYVERPDGCYPINVKDIYLCISLGEPLEGFCYKLVAGVIGLKG